MKSKDRVDGALAILRSLEIQSAKYAEAYAKLQADAEATDAEKAAAHTDMCSARSSLIAASLACMYCLTDAEYGQVAKRIVEA